MLGKSGEGVGQPTERGMVKTVRGKGGGFWGGTAKVPVMEV